MVYSIVDKLYYWNINNDKCIYTTRMYNIKVKVIKNVKQLGHKVECQGWGKNIGHNVDFIRWEWQCR